MPEKVFVLSHELRHAWQKKYHKDTYDTYNVSGIDVLSDLSEVDADAFALAFFFSESTPFSSDDIPGLYHEISLRNKYDGGQRLAKAHIIAEEYGLGKISI